MPTYLEVDAIKSATNIGTLANSAITIGNSSKSSVSTSIENNLTINAHTSTDSSHILSLVNSENAADADVMMSYIASDKGYATGIRGSNDNFEIAYKADTDTDLDDTNLVTLSTIGALTVRDNITAYSSDKRLKKDIIPLENPLTKLQTLSGFTYRWNIDKGKRAGFEPVDEEQVGVFAQDVQEVVPQAVKPAPFDADGNGGSKSGDNYLTVQYEKLVPLLIESIKEQQQQINSLSEKIKLLEKNNE